jgi:two-component system response regulator AgrA
MVLLNNIIICDDNNIYRDKIISIIKDAIAINDWNFRIALKANKPDIVIDYINKNPNSSSIYFLDIDLKSDINGVKLAELIRKKDRRSHIIFITNHPEMSLMTFKYKVQALDFILKDDLKDVKDKINECLKYINDNYFVENENEDMLTIEQKERIINIKINDILLIESLPSTHKIVIYGQNKTVELYGTLNRPRARDPDHAAAGRRHRSSQRAPARRLT